MKIIVFFLAVSNLLISAQRITTIQLDGVQYFISRMNPYSPELNYFLAYQYCRSLGLQLVSFETKEKADIMTQYLKNAGYSKYDFWTSGNNLGTDMFLWMSSGLPFNATFDYMVKSSNNKSIDVPPGTEPQRVARESVNNGVIEGCVVMESPNLKWNILDCMLVKDFICEQTRCYYYNYGSIPVSASQGKTRPYLIISTTEKNIETSQISESTIKPLNATLKYKFIRDRKTEGSVPKNQGSIKLTDEIIPIERETEENEANRLKHLPNIATLFTDSRISKENVFAGLETHEVRSTSKNSAKINRDLLHSKIKETEATDAVFTEDYTVGPYDSIDFDFQADQADYVLNYKKDLSNIDDDSSTTVPEIEPFYKYHIKIRNNGKVLGSSVK
ncbi:uncharacterized protein LOC131672227 [Phymastichus coffea]|uniref:uncharacterized protein LOC131672227 n=1 Tax=Phymastichus coffea TaxID=108790 RepID=UPI00273AC6E1|nr:uncharacterized protein LOC131672227 [Phymastichus coffea]